MSKTISKDFIVSLTISLTIGLVPIGKPRPEERRERSSPKQKKRVKVKLT